MELKIKATGVAFSPELSSYIEERIAPLEKLLGENATLAICEVEVGRDAGRPRHGKNVFFAEINITPPGEGVIRVTNHAETVNGAIDDARDELFNRLRKMKTKRFARMRRMGAHVKQWIRFGRGS